VRSVADVVSKPTEESIRAAFAEAERETAFWRAHYGEYVVHDPDQFVAVGRDEKATVAITSLRHPRLAVFPKVCPARTPRGSRLPSSHGLAAGYDLSPPTVPEQDLVKAERAPDGHCLSFGEVRDGEAGLVAGLDGGGVTLGDVNRHGGGRCVR
jgi:hypothetical protein